MRTRTCWAGSFVKIPGAAVLCFFDRKRKERENLANKRGIIVSELPSDGRRGVEEEEGCPRVIPIILLGGNKANRSSSFAQASVEDARGPNFPRLSRANERKRNRRLGSRDVESTDANTRHPSHPSEPFSLRLKIDKRIRRTGKRKDEKEQHWKRFSRLALIISL